MAASRTFNMLRLLQHNILRFEVRLLQALSGRGPHDQGTPALVFADSPAPIKKSAPQDGKSLLDSIFDGILWIAVPKRRRSLERRRIRKFGVDKVSKFLTPRKDLVSCLECGHWHEPATVCGNCYEMVREETKVMRETMDEDDRLFNAPKSEIVYLYGEEKDDREMYAGKYIVEMDKKRPEWWSSHQLTKGNKR